MLPLIVNLLCSVKRLIALLTVIQVFISEILKFVSVYDFYLTDISCTSSKSVSHIAGNI
jgi:hypothetical protein